MEWISVSDRLPPNSNEVLVLDECEVYFLAYFNHNEWNDTTNYIPLANVTHWQPLPKLPNV